VCEGPRVRPSDFTGKNAGRWMREVTPDSGEPCEASGGWRS